MGEGIFKNPSSQVQLQRWEMCTIKGKQKVSKESEVLEPGHWAVPPTGAANP